MQGDTVGPLPRWPTSFVGRAEELVELRRLVGRSRLVTVTGPGGAGKTRLAAGAASELFDRFPGGVFFVDLASLSEREQLEPAITGAVAVGDTGLRSPIEATTQQLRGARGLLVLDNCEHLIAGCAQVVRGLIDG